MDAYCLIDIIKELAKLAIEKGDPVLLLENQKHSLNWLETNRPHHNMVENRKKGNYQQGKKRNKKQQYGPKHHVGSETGSAQQYFQNHNQGYNGGYNGQQNHNNGYYHGHKQ